MDFKNKIVDGAVVAVIVIIALIGWSLFTGHRASSGPGNFQAGAAGNLLAENYDGGYLQQNGGFNSALPMTTTGLLTVSGGQTFSGNLTNTGTEKIGATGSAVTQLNFGATGDKVIAYSNTITASSTARFDLGSTGQVGGTLTGVAVGDQCDVFATTTVGAWGGLQIIGSFASTTAGYCTVNVFNGTGGTFTWSNTASTSYAHQSLR